ncbi:ubiquitin-like modifier HUB1 [Aspergillus udagawae]|uniref:Ubiquitin-like modifier HUB1 n=1 Tax=Aspergillus udagawae TaxID=91492 RepID=A0A8H3P1S4_9EURO|nr:uncharacterized protein Aud_003619 [Aspergillus udagawae]GFF41349.1 ubiquitin-like modifier HUB1 [Aspergillus udagawae]GFF90856.1 ubiquitin-like modifier HUB1 [Aspergillus udagawae]GFG24432.1 ubiquitin-like modifier HUB1 [Aspergillus udagawae]GIC87238.1 hypothetical protein Aud_003619 [Aspergillus udagawae]
MGDRSRSRSPRRRYDGDRDRPRKAGGGFRWKDKRHDGDRPGAEDSRLSRGYRDRGDRPRSPRRERDSDRYRDSYRDGDRERRRPDDSQRDERVEKKKEKKPEKKPEKKAVVAPQSSEPMIVVHVNDRLGTKAAIPCLASDPIKLFKAQVAARIGREPHEILLKRQGERPFKDQLTLEDYGVSNGVQLDLEVGTGE